MVHKRNVIAARLPQPEFDGRWGLRSALDGRWLPVVYASEAEASAAASGRRASPVNDNGSVPSAQLSWG